MRNLILFGLCIFIFSRFIFAEAQISKEWHWDLSSSDEYAYAATVNSDGRVLGQYCYYSDSSCVYLVRLGIICEADSEYPSILNSDAGAADVRLICGHEIDGENVFFINPFDDVDNIVLSASTVGFAVALEEGTFKVVRFSLSGSTHAIKMMRLGAELIQGEKSENQQKDKSEEYL